MGAVRVEVGTVRGGGGSGWRWGRFGVEVGTVRGGGCFSRMVEWNGTVEWNGISAPTFSN